MRLINADVLDEIITTLNEQGWSITRSEYKLINSVLFEFPTIAAKPKKHGRWLYNKLWGTECSECGYAMFELVGVRYTTCKPKYCPNCGAKMDEEDL